MMSTRRCETDVRDVGGADEDRAHDLLNAILDLVTDDPRWGQWSADALSRAADESSLAINPLIFAEVSIGFETVEELERLLPPQELLPPVFIP